MKKILLALLLFLTPAIVRGQGPMFCPAGQTLQYVNGAFICNGPNGATSTPIYGYAQKPFTSDAIQYVSANGNDANDGLSWGTAKATIAAANAASPATGALVRMSCGSFALPAGIVITAPVAIVGQGDCTQISYASATGTAFTFNVTSTSLAHRVGFGLRDLVVTGSGAGNATVGIFAGGTNATDGMYVSNVKIASFGTGLEFGNNAFLVNFANDQFQGNGINVSVPSGLTGSGEGISFDRDVFATGGAYGGNFASCFNVALTVNNLTVSNSSFDQCQVTLGAGQVHFVNVHFENPNGAITVPFIVNSSARLSLVDSDFQLDGTDAISPSAFGQSTGGVTDLIGASFFYAAGGLSDDWSLSGAAEFHEFGTKLSSGTAAFIANSSSGQVTTYGNVWGNNVLLGSSFSVGSGSPVSSSGAGGTLASTSTTSPQTFLGAIAMPGFSLTSSSGGSITHQAPNTAAAITVTDPVATTLTPIAGTCTMTTTTCTITVVSGASHCVATDSGGTIAGQCAISGTTLTVTAASSNTSAWSVLWW